VIFLALLTEELRIFQAWQEQPHVLEDLPQVVTDESGQVPCRGTVLELHWDLAG
jgi:hypothetical protein